MAIKYHGQIPLCWRVRIQRPGRFESSVKGPYTYRKALRVVEIARSNGDKASLEEDREATAKHRAMINARRWA